MTKDQWFDLYSQSHQNPVNRAIHKICVPAIVVAQTGLLWLIPSPLGLPPGAIAAVELALAMCFYLSWRDYKLGMKLFVFYIFPNLMFWSILSQHAERLIAPVAILVFVSAWVGQFVGHRLEGKKPSFFQDIQFLLIGPAWVLTH